MTNLTKLINQFCICLEFTVLTHLVKLIEKKFRKPNVMVELII